ncbi:NACHT domain-containing protein [Actinoplanes oblitus]|uniref:NACHT domain-containing protein n=1 Tax=Actinoplanes oblitus TaxID=3040509 RepID=A0ABY8W5Q8_9ACTN|nr:NACHT domain-containing protein [Actinoplanes oblitus]WIM92842.1 NACHT domain-containing protein [Actinoplanes oblitus]
MSDFASWLEISDKIGSVVGAATGVLALVLDHRSRSAEPPQVARHRVRLATVFALALLAFGLVAFGLLALSAHFAPGLPAALPATAGWALPPLAIATLIIALRARRAGRSPRMIRPPELDQLAIAQQAEVVHRYHFFGFHAPALSEIHVRRRMSTSGTREADRHTLIDADGLLDRQAHALILGGAGSGKSTVAAMMVREAARLALTGNTPRMAVACTAADLTDQELPEALAAATLRDLGVAATAALFQRPPLPGGTWLVIVDGADEVIDTDARARMLWRLHSLLQKEVTLHRIIVTSRALPTAELAELRRPGVEEYELRPFDRTDLDAFARRWFAARLPGDPDAATRNAILFLARLAGARLGPVARIPLLATIAAMVFEQADSRALPTSRALLYESFIDHLMDGRHELSSARRGLLAALRSRGQDGKGVATWFDDDFYPIIGRLLDAMGVATFDDPAADLLTVALDWIDRNAPLPLTALLPGARQTIDDILRATAVLTPRQGRLLFAHQSFADFFAARATARCFDADAWYALAADPAARSRAAFAAAWQPTSDHLVRTLLDDRQDAVAAGDMIADGVPVGDRTRQRVVTALVEQLNHDAPTTAECLRVIRELCADLAALSRIAELANDAGTEPWVRAMLADAIADIDRATGVRVLRDVMRTAPRDVQDWVAGVLDERGIPAEPAREAMDAPGITVRRPLGRIGRLALARRAGDPRTGDRERLAAATRLCDDGDTEPLRALLDDPETDLMVRFRAAIVFAEHGEDAPLYGLARGDNLLSGVSSTTWLRFLAVRDLIRRDARGTDEILHALVTDSGQVPLTYGAAALLAQSGEPDVLERMTYQPVAESSWPQSPIVPIALGIAAAGALGRRAEPDSIHRALAGQPVPAVRAFLLAGLVRLGEDRAAMPLRDLLRSRRRSWRHRIHPWERRPELHALLAQHRDGASLQWLRHRVHPLMPPKRRLVVAVALSQVDEPAGTRALRRIAAGRWQPPQVRVLATERLHADPVQASRALRALTGSPRIRLAAAIRLARVHRDESLLDAMLHGTATGTRHREHVVATLTDGLSESWRDKETALLDHSEWKRFGRLDSLAPGFPFPARPRHPPARVIQLQRLAADSATPPGLRIAAAAALLPSAAGIDALSSLARDPHVPGRYRHRAVIALAAWQPRAARPLVAEAVRRRWMSRVPTWQLLLALVDLPRRGEDGVLDSPEFDSIARQISALRDRAWFTRPFHLVRHFLSRPTLDRSAPTKSGDTGPDAPAPL